MTVSGEPFAVFVCGGSPAISDSLPDGYSFEVWKPTVSDPVPSTLGAKAVVWSLFRGAGLFANDGYRVVYVRHGARIVHRSCVVPRYYRWPFMGHDDLQVSSTWTEPHYRGKRLASLALSYILRTMEAPGRRFWYVSRESNVPSIRVCERVGFELAGYAVRTSRFGLRALGQIVPRSEHRAPMPEAQSSTSGAVASAAEWYIRYYSKAGLDRNDLRTNRGALFQMIASERSLIQAFYRIPLNPHGISVLDVGCGSGAAWYQLFRLGVRPSKTVGVDLQFGRLANVSNLYPQSVAIHADAVSMPFANASFDLVYESTLFATLPDDRVRVGIASEMLRVCRPGGYLLLVDWRTPKFLDQNYKALTRSELRRLFGKGRATTLLGVFRGALVPPLGRVLSTYAQSLYFLIAGLCPPLVGQVTYLLCKHPDTLQKS